MAAARPPRGDLAELLRVLLDGLASGLEVELLEVRPMRGGRLRLELRVHAPPTLRFSVDEPPPARACGPKTDQKPITSPPKSAPVGAV
jgi:hypothetical protein